MKDILYSERFVDKAPREIFARLLDEGEYLCSVRTMYRILDEDKARRNGNGEWHIYCGNVPGELDG